MYSLATCVHDHMLSHIRYAMTPKEVWENLKKIFSVNRSARKLQLRQEFNNIQQKDMSVSDYTSKIKRICDSLGSINVNIDDDEMSVGQPNRRARHGSPLQQQRYFIEKDVRLIAKGRRDG